MLIENEIMSQVGNGTEYIHALLRDAFLSGDFGEFTDSINNEDKPELWQTWTVGLSIISISAWGAPLGMLLIPLLSNTMYDRFMTFLVALGIGAMSGSVIFILLPSAFLLTELESFGYPTKCWLIVSALYTFFAVDRALQFFIEFRRRRTAKRKVHASTLRSVIQDSSRKEQKKRRKNKLRALVFGGGKKSALDENGNAVDLEREKEDLKDEFEVQMITNNLVRSMSTRRRVAIVQADTDHVDEVRYKTAESTFVNMDTLKGREPEDDEDGDQQSNSTIPAADIASASDSGKTHSIEMTAMPSGYPHPPPSGTPSRPPTHTDPDPELGLSVQVVEKHTFSKHSVEVANVAYMIIFGSSANNFVDGMSTGAAFSDSIARGVSIGLAVISQQFPQELGTLAILVKSGLGLKRALLYNMIPVVLSYIGFAVGVMLDNVDESYDEYIYSISSGMYFYIFLGTLLPEIRDSLSDVLKVDMAEAILITVLQFSGFAFALAFMYFMSVYSKEPSD